jgi:hypothetical protein
MNRDIRWITVRLANQVDAVQVQATVYRNWAVHQTLGSNDIDWTVTYVPVGFYVEKHMTREAALRLAERLEQVCPNFSPDQKEIVKAEIVSAQEARRAR